MTASEYEGSIASLTPTVCALFRIPPPKACAEPALASVMRYALDELRGDPVERCLVYCPDALGEGTSTRKRAGAITAWT
jgi:hypothetical protein